MNTYWCKRHIASVNEYKSLRIRMKRHCVNAALELKKRSSCWWFSNTSLYACKPVHTLLFGAQLCMTIKTHVTYDCI